MNIIKIGIVGVGGRGMTFWRNMHMPEQGCKVVAGADTSENALNTFKKEIPDALTFHDYKELLAISELDAVLIITPDYLHCEMALAALSAGKTVYLEKPLAITISDCDLILEEAMKTGNKLYIGHNLRFFPVVAKMKEIIDSGIIGKVKTCWCRHFVNYGGDAYFKDWHSERKNIYGLLLQKGAHDIDAIHYLMGAYSSSVNGMGMLSVYDKCRRRVPGEPAPAEWVQDDNLYPPEDVEGFSPVIDVEDHNMIMMQLANGAQACYMQSHYAPDNERNYAIIGTRGRLENIGDAANAEIHVWTRRGKRSEPDIVYSVPAKAGSHSGADPLIMRNFIDFAAGRALAITSPVAAREAVAAGFLAHESMRGDGGLRKIPALAQDIIDYFTNGIYPEL